MDTDELVDSYYIRSKVLRRLSARYFIKHSDISLKDLVFIIDRNYVYKLYAYGDIQLDDKPHYDNRFYIKPFSILRSFRPLYIRSQHIKDIYTKRIAYNSDAMHRL